MGNSTISLKTTQISSTVLTVPASNRYFAFSRQFNRAQLAEGYAQKAPSQIVTALNVTKIAPAIFFMIEKLAAALEVVLNRGASLLGCPVSAMDDHEIVVVDTSGKAEKMLAKVIDKQFFTPTPIKAETTVVEEPVSPVMQEETPMATVDENPATPIPLKEQTTIVQTQRETPKEDGLDKYNDLLIEPKVLPPATSNTKRNLLIGAGVATVIGGVGYYLASRSSNNDYFDPDTMCGLDDEQPCEEPTANDTATCSITQLLDGKTDQMTKEELAHRDLLLEHYAYDSSAYEYDENAERCWVVKHDVNEAEWCERPLCADAPGGSDAEWCFDDENIDHMYEDGSPFTVWKETTGDSCIKVTCNELFACDNDPLCKD